MDNTNQHDDGDERLAGDLLVGADKIRAASSFRSACPRRPPIRIT